MSLLSLITVCILADVSWSESENLMTQGVLGQDAITPIYLWPEYRKGLCTGALAMQANMILEQFKC